MNGYSGGYHPPPRFLKLTANVSAPEPDANAVLRRTWCGCEGFQGPFQSVCTPLCFYVGLGGTKSHRRVKAEPTTKQSLSGLRAQILTWSEIN